MEEKTEVKQEKTVATRKVRVHRNDLPNEWREAAILIADIAMDKHTIEKDVATELKKHCDLNYGGTWHAVVGSNFGSSITHYTKFLVFFQLDGTHVLLFCSDMPTSLLQKNADSGAVQKPAEPPAEAEAAE
ncbi:hypothetical protein M885DRAFT_514274 [Pelagophyceae sp. CCMP2097]|nr:hypothetical protein M885DRAFT_514274 [Pelagophyceae sp. CCMP2097]